MPCKKNVRKGRLKTRNRKSLEKLGSGELVGEKNEGRKIESQERGKREEDSGVGSVGEAGKKRE